MGRGKRSLGGVPEAPPFPVLSLEIRRAEDGSGEVWLDSERVGVAAGVDDPGLYDAGREAAAVRAAERSGARAIRVLAVRADGTRDELVVDADGQVFEVGASAPARRGSGSGLGSRWVEFSVRERVTLVGLCTVGVLAVGAVVGMAWPAGDQGPARAAVSTSSEPAPRPTPTQLPVLGPAGQVATAEWSTGPVADDAPVVVAGGRVVTVSDDNELMGVDPRTSAVVWSTAVGDAPDELRSGRVGGREVVFAVSGSRVLVVDARSGKRLWKRELGSGEEAVMTAQGPLVRRGKVTALVRSASGEWVERVVPPGADPVGVLGSDVVSVNASGQWWRVNSHRVPPATQRFPAPEKGAVARGVLGMTQEFLLFAWVGKDGAKQLVQQFSWEDLEKPVRVFTAGRGDAGEPAEDAARVAPSQTWMVLDQDVVNLKTGRVKRLPEGWSTASVVEDRAYSDPVDEKVMVSDPAGTVATLPVGSVDPSDLGVPVAQVGGLSLFVAGEDSKRLYAVRLGESSAAAGPSSTTTPKPSGTPVRSSAPVASPKPSSPGKDKKPASTPRSSTPKAAGSSVKRPSSASSTPSRGGGGRG